MYIMEKTDHPDESFRRDEDADRRTRSVLNYIISFFFHGVWTIFKVIKHLWVCLLLSFRALREHVRVVFAQQLFHKKREKRVGHLATLPDATSKQRRTSRHNICVSKDLLFRKGRNFYSMLLTVLYTTYLEYLMEHKKWACELACSGMPMLYTSFFRRTGTSWLPTLSHRDEPNC